MSFYCLMRDAPVIGLACVIDWPGYNKRYAEKYAENRWMLCKTAFSVVVERAAKFAISKRHAAPSASRKVQQARDNGKRCILSLLLSVCCGQIANYTGAQRQWLNLFFYYFSIRCNRVGHLRLTRLRAGIAPHAMSEHELPWTIVSAAHLHRSL